MLPFLKRSNLIVESEYELNALDAMELLLALMKKEISIVKFKQAFEEFVEKKKHDKESKQTRKPAKNNRKK